MKSQQKKQLQILEAIRALVDDGPIRIYIGEGDNVFEITDYVPEPDRNELICGLEDDIQKLKDMEAE